MAYCYDMALCDGGACPQRMRCLRALSPLYNRADMFGSPPYAKDGSCEHLYLYTRVRIGNQTSAHAPSALLPFEFALTNQFDAFEFFPDHGAAGKGGWDLATLPKSCWDDIRRKAQAEDMTLSVHAPLFKPVLAGPAGQILAEELEFARYLGASVFVLHLDFAKGMAAFAEAIFPLFHVLDSFSCRLALENTPQTNPVQINDFFAAFCGKHPALRTKVGLCFDMGHANLCSMTHNDYHGFLDKLAAEIPIVHVHLHENWGDADTHLPLFAGPSAKDEQGIRGVLMRLGKRHFEGAAIMEQWPADPNMLVVIQKKLAGWLSYDWYLWTKETELREQIKKPSRPG